MYPASRILITRPQAEAEKLALVLKEEGFEPIIFPSMEIKPYDQDQPLEEAFKKADKLIFVSRNAVKQVLEQHSSKLKKFKGAVFAIGEGTASELYACGIKEVLYPSPPYNSESLLELPELEDILDQQICIIAGLGGREFLAHTLVERGADVSTLAIYQRQKANYPETTLEHNIQKADAVISTSSESLQFLFEIVSDNLHLKTLLLNLPLLVIGRNMVELAKKIGFSNTLLASGADDNSIVETLNQWTQKSNLSLSSKSSAFLS